jgi:hypothetical protein
VTNQIEIGIGDWISCQGKEKTGNRECTTATIFLRMTSSGGNGGCRGGEGGANVMGRMWSPMSPSRRTTWGSDVVTYGYFFVINMTSLCDNSNSEVRIFNFECLDNSIIIVQNRKKYWWAMTMNECSMKEAMKCTQYTPEHVSTSVLVRMPQVLLKRCCILDYIF